METVMVKCEYCGADCEHMVSDGVPVPSQYHDCKEGECTCYVSNTCDYPGHSNAVGREELIDLVREIPNYTTPCTSLHEEAVDVLMRLDSKYACGCGYCPRPESS